MTCEMKLHVFDPPSWICHLGFNFVLKSQEINLRKLTKYQARMLMECTNSWIAVIIIMKKTEKKITELPQKGWSLVKATCNLMGAMVTSKMMDTQLTCHVKISIENEGTATESFSHLE